MQHKKKEEEEEDHFEQFNKSQKEKQASYHKSTSNLSQLYDQP